MFDGWDSGLEEGAQRWGAGNDLSCFEYGPLGIMALSRSSIFLNFIFFSHQGKVHINVKIILNYDISGI